MWTRRITTAPSMLATARQCVSSTKQTTVGGAPSWWTSRGLDETLRSSRAVSQTRSELSRWVVTKKIWSGEATRWTTGEPASRKLKGAFSWAPAEARDPTVVRLAEAFRRLLTAAAGLMRGPKSCADSLRLSR